jgi:hypothetical protein
MNYWAGHSGQLSPIESRTSIAKAASCGTRPEADPDGRCRTLARGRAGRRGLPSSHAPRIRGWLAPQAERFLPSPRSFGKLAAAPLSSASQSLLRPGKRIRKDRAVFRLVAQGRDSKSRRVAFSTCSTAIQKTILSLSSLSAPPATILSVSSGSGRCSALASSHGACIGRGVMGFWRCSY